ncbi:diguanylate cyclase [Parafrankia soli]|uniref:Diguanylate cyclase n=2 Tax=Parafrankia soli TaxID=2599596 RepID=A0A1S1Q6Z0_9ACTN|nr:diguanylate cyclase [Parafrankia soli]
MTMGGRRHRMTPGDRARRRVERRRVRRERRWARWSFGRGRLAGWPLVSGLIAILALSGVALAGGSRWLADIERDRLANRVSLISNLATWESTADDPAGLRAVVERTAFDPNDKARNHQLAAQFQITPAGDTTLLVALLDHAGTLLSVRPAQGAVSPEDLGPAWSTAWSGGSAVSPVFPFNGHAARATVIPVGGPRPWAVLVSVSTEESKRQLGTGMGTLLRLRGQGAVSTIDARGIAVVSTDLSLPGTRVLDPAELSAAWRSTNRTRVWTTGGEDGYTHVAAAQPATGYTTYLVQPTAQLYAELREQRSHRNITLLVVTMAAVLSIAVVGLHEETRARRRHGKLSSLLAATRDIVMTVSAAGRLEYVSPAAATRLGHDPAALRGRPLSDLMRGGDAERVAALLDEPLPATVMNVRLLSAAGHEHWFDVSARRLADETGSPRAILTFHSIERRKSLLDQLGFQAGHDLLTGLANRATFDERLAGALGHQPAGGALALLYIDLDHFKPINDTYGHAAGDRVLTVVASRLTGTVGAGIAAGPDADADAGAGAGSTVSRFGGDEFGILLPGADETAAGAIAARVVAALGEPIDLDETRVTVAASVGVAVARGTCRPEQLLRAADQAMYQAKAAGRARYSIGVVAEAEPDPSEAVAPTPPMTPAAPQAPGTPATGSPSVSPPPAARPSSRRLSVAHPSARRLSVRRLSVRRPSPRRPSVRRRGGTRPPAPLRHRLAAAIPSATVVVVLLGTVTAGLAMETTARDRAQKQRIDAGVELVTHVAEYAHALSDPGRLTGVVSEMPWPLGNPAALTEVLRVMGTSAVAGPGSLLAVVAPDGRPMATEPPGTPVPIPVGDDLWFDASRKGALTPMILVNGRSRICSIVPILRGGSAAAQLLLCPTNVLPAARTLRSMNGLSGDLGRGGISVLDVRGRAVLSWDEALVGRTLVEPADLEQVRDGTPGLVRSASRPDTIAVATAIPGGGYVLLDQTADLFQLSLLEYRSIGDGLLFGIIGVTVIGLAVANRRRERAVRQDFEQLDMLLHGAHDIVILLDRSGRLDFVSSAAEPLLGRDSQEMLGHDLLRYVHPEDRAAVREFLAGPAGEAADGRALQDIRLEARDGSHRWFDIEATACAPRPPAARARGPVLTCREIGERRGLTEQLRRRARHDPLTGLPNRAALAEHLDAVARRRTAYAVLLVDLDYFKPVNDSFGHEVGDHVLRVTATRIRRVLTGGGAGSGSGSGDGAGGGTGSASGDTDGGVDASGDNSPRQPDTAPVPGGAAGAGERPRFRRRPSSWFGGDLGGSWNLPEQGEVFRVGGDEFVAVLAGPATALAGGLDVEAVARQTADQITAIVREPIHSGGRLVTVGATVGVALSRGAAAPEAVLRLADAAMYQAKRSRPDGRPPGEPLRTSPPARPLRAPGTEPAPVTEAATPADTEAEHAL